MQVCVCVGTAQRREALMMLRRLVELVWLAGLCRSAGFISFSTIMYGLF